MTRRKRTTSPSPPPPPPRKCPGFEIPASLHQLSAISRSLAQQADTLSSDVHKNGANTLLSVSSPSPIQATAFHPVGYRSTQPVESMLPVKFVSQRQSFPESQPWPQPVPRLAAISAVNKYLPPAPISPDPPKPSQAPPEIPRPLPPQAPKISPPSSARELGIELGGPLSLRDHSSQIGALIAKKRAENEVNGHRERLAKRQMEYRMSQAAKNQMRAEQNVEPRTLARREGVGTTAQPGDPAPKRSFLTVRPVGSEREPVQNSAEKAATTTTATILSQTRLQVKRSDQEARRVLQLPSPFPSPVINSQWDDGGIHTHMGRPPSASGLSRSNQTSIRKADQVVPKPKGPATRDYYYSAESVSTSITIPPLFSDRPQQKQARLPQEHAPFRQPQPTQQPPKEDSSWLSVSEASPTPSRHQTAAVTPGYYKLNPRHWEVSDPVPRDPAALPSPDIYTSALYNSSPFIYSARPPNDHADVVGGVNTTFRHSTKEMFRVPKR